jgi:hypothetical protein
VACDGGATSWEAVAFDPQRHSPDAVTPCERTDAAIAGGQLLAWMPPSPLYKEGNLDAQGFTYYDKA